MNQLAILFNIGICGFLQCSTDLSLGHSCDRILTLFFFNQLRSYKGLNV